ncbi:MAG TPA: sirohydrochlorin chelatase [Pseudonocardia sp.]|jgi:sirohydrochlorin ferrochelatase|nr:sirohydrochlorin chelatase [Pseudonocardia sp.]
MAARSVGRPALVAVAHGSRDPRSAATVFALIERVQALRPDLTVRLCFLDLNTPRLPDVLTSVAEEGHRAAVVVPLLLGRAFHAKVDVPGAVARAARRHPSLRLSVADVLGRDDRLADTALLRLGAVAGPLDASELGVVLSSVGSSHPEANDAVQGLVSGWSTRYGWSGGVAAFGTAASPTVPEAIDRLRAAGAERIAVASWFLAPGLIPERVLDAVRRNAPEVPVADPLGSDRAVAEVVLDRYLAVARSEAIPRLQHVS